MGHALRLGLQHYGFWAALLVAIAACGGESGSSAADRQRQSRACGSVVATVNGSPIGIEDVRELVLHTGLSPREALARLEDALLVEQAAAKRPTGDVAAARETRRVLVQVLLAHTVEQEVRPERIPIEQVRERFEQVRGRLNLSAGSFAQHEQAIREQLTIEQRKLALEKLITELRASTKVVLDEAEVQKALSSPSLWGGNGT
jgi:hypothetical protein